MLDLSEPPPDRPEGRGRGNLRLVPRWPRVVFRRPEDPEISWTIRITAYALSLVITGLAVGVILLVAAWLKEVYQQVDAQDAARAAESARAKAAEPPPAPPGTVVITLPKGGSAPPGPDPNRPGPGP
jgi:hypothetical protein